MYSLCLFWYSANCGVPYRWTLSTCQALAEGLSLTFSHPTTGHAHVFPWCAFCTCSDLAVQLLNHSPHSACGHCHRGSPLWQAATWSSSVRLDAYAIVHLAMSAVHL